MITGADLFIGLAHNLAIFIALVAVYGAVIDRIGNLVGLRRQLVLGLSFGVFAVGCMYAKIPAAEGVVVDQRNAVVILSGAFGGPLSAVLSAGLAAIVRFQLGGIGVVGGITGLALSAIAGSVMHRYLRNRLSTGPIALGAFAAVLFVLPGFLLVGDLAKGWALLKSVAVPYGTAIFIGIFLGGLLLANEERRMIASVERERIEKQRQQAMQELQAANKAKSEFMAAMSHELRTPSNAILGFSDMIIRMGDLAPERRHEYAQDIQSSGHHLLDLINDILDITTIEAGKRALERRDVDISKILAGCVRAVENAAAHKDVRVMYNPMQPTIRAYADERCIRQIVLNLLSNAVKFSAAGGEVIVNAVNETDGLRITVTDQGIGIPEDHLPHIGEPFFRTDSNPHLATEGTGLGLSIVKSLLIMHGGTMTIDSVVGQGTGVEIRLPSGNAKEAASVAV